MADDELVGLLRQCSSRDESKREQAVDLLWTLALDGGRRRQLALQGIRGCTSDPVWSVRNVAVEALGEIGNSNDIYRLRIALGDREWVVRASAVASLASRGGIRVTKTLVSVLENDLNEVVRAYAAVGIADLGSASSIPTLRNALDPESNERAAVGIVHALILLGETSYIPKLASLLRPQSDWPVISDIAMSILEEIMAAPTTREHAEIIRKELRHYLQKDRLEPWRKEKAETLLEKLGPK